MWSFDDELVSPETRTRTISLLSGPTIEVTVTSPFRGKRSWNLHIALLLHHSKYIQRRLGPHYSPKSETETIVIHNIVPGIFELFIEYMLYSCYTCDMGDSETMMDFHEEDKIFTLAHAWALGDYLDAPDFQNRTISYLYDTLGPDCDNRISNVVIRPIAIKDAFECCPLDSPFAELIMNFMAMHWHSSGVIDYLGPDDTDWNEFWYEYPEIRNKILFKTSQSREERALYLKEVEKYFVS